MSDEPVRTEETKEEADAEESDFEVGGEEELFLPGGVPVDVVEQAAQEKQEHDAAYYAAVQAEAPPQIPPAADAD